MATPKEELGQIVGPERVLDDADMLNACARDESFVHPLKPRLIVKPLNSTEVQEIVQWANRTNTPLVPVSSGPPHFRGDTVPTAPGAVMIDLTGMKKSSMLMPATG